MLENNLPTLKHIIKVLLISALIIFVLAFCGDNLRSTNNHRTSKDYKYISCYTYSQELVKQKLNSPKSADFPAYSKSYITDKSNTILVSAYVDAENSFGATVRVYYNATIQLEDDEPVSGTVTIIE